MIEKYFISKSSLGIIIILDQASDSMLLNPRLLNLLIIQTKYYFPSVGQKLIFYSKCLGPMFVSLECLEYQGFLCIMFLAKSFLSYDSDESMISFIFR